MTTEHDPAEPGATLDNPYWEAVADRVVPDHMAVFDPGGWCIGGPVKNAAGSYDFQRMYSIGAESRFEVVGRYAWTVTDPATVAFVTEHAGPAVLDPMAGSGYWAYLLRQQGLDVAAYDLNPPAAGANKWHKEGVEHVPVLPGDAATVTGDLGSGRTLLLSWPPYDTDDGARALAAYPGDRVVYIGEFGECCGDAALFEALETDWGEVACHRPVQWFGLHDYVTVHSRIKLRALT